MTHFSKMNGNTTEGSDQPVRWGLIGAGNVCEHKAGPPLYGVKASELVLVHRRDRAAGEDFVRRHGHGAYVGSLREMLHSDAIDAVYVASPHALHAGHTIAALEAGKHVLVEKPMALHQEECDRMIAAAEANGRSLGVAYYRRGYPSVAHVRKLIADGVIGEVTSASFNNEFPTSHRLDLVHHFFGPINAVRILGGREDAFLFESVEPRFDVRSASGVQIRMITAWAESGMPEAFVVCGTRGILHVADLKKGCLIREVDGAVALEMLGSLPFTHWGLVENFVAHLRKGEPLLCDGVEGRKSTVILDLLGAERTSDKWAPVDYGESGNFS
jgi:predicted dehydrogenase